MKAGAHFGHCIRPLGPSEEIQIYLLVCLLFAEWLLYMCLFCNDLFFPLLLLLPAITPFWNAVFLRAYFFFSLLLVVVGFVSLTDFLFSLDLFRCFLTTIQPQVLKPCTMPRETLHYPDHWYSSFRITSDEGKQLVSISLAIISTTRSLCSTPHRLSHHHAADAGTAPGSDGRTASVAGAAAEQHRFPGIESGLAKATEVDRRFRKRTGSGAKGGAAASDNELAGAVE